MTLMSDDAAAAVYEPPTYVPPVTRPSKPTAAARCGKRRVNDDPIITGREARRSAGKLGAPVALAAARAEPHDRAARSHDREPDVTPWAETPEGVAAQHAAETARRARVEAARTAHADRVARRALLEADAAETAARQAAAREQSRAWAARAAARSAADPDNG